MLIFAAFTFLFLSALICFVAAAGLGYEKVDSEHQGAMDVMPQLLSGVEDKYLIFTMRNDGNDTQRAERVTLSGDSLDELIAALVELKKKT